jgi:hypothetical protein
MLCGVGGVFDRAALVAALKAVQGVADADVDPDENGGLGTLRLDLVPGVDESVVARQVSKVLRERFGLGVDADRAELVEAPRAEEEARPVAEEARSITLPVPRSGHRASIAKIHLLSEGLDVTASVTLSYGGRMATGESRGTASASGTHRAVATATLLAVEELVGPGVRVELEHLEVASTGRERTVLVLLTMLTAQGSETLTGAAGVRDDVRQAVIRATLDALNRRLELLLTEV